MNDSMRQDAIPRRYHDRYRRPGGFRQVHGLEGSGGAAASATSTRARCTVRRHGTAWIGGDLTDNARGCSGGERDAAASGL